MTAIDVMWWWAVNLPGFVAGLVTGWVLRDRWGNQMRNRLRELSSGAAQVLIISLVMLIFGFGFLTTRAGDQRIVDCVQEYNEAQSAAQRPRTDALEQRDAALSHVVDAVPGVLTDRPTVASRARLEVAISNFRRLDADLRTAREKNPYPEAPKTLCED